LRERGRTIENEHAGGAFLEEAFDRPTLMRVVQAAAKIAIYDKKSPELAREHFRIAVAQRGTIRRFTCGDRNSSRSRQDTM
jgi:hypothetical protein